MAPLIPKLRVPLQMGEHGLLTVEQGSEDEVAACVYALLAAERGSRIEEPEYGVEDPTFEQIPLVTDEWLRQIEIWEPRAEVQVAQDVVDLLDTISVGTAIR